MYAHTLVFNKLDFMNKGCRGVRGACMLTAFNKPYANVCVCANIGHVIRFMMKPIKIHPIYV